MKKNVLTRQQAHELLMQNNNHYLWNVPYRKWTEEDYQNLINGVNRADLKKPKGNKVGFQPVKAVYQNGNEKVFKSIADASRKTGIGPETIRNDINGNRILQRPKFPSFQKVNP